MLAPTSRACAFNAAAGGSVAFNIPTVVGMLNGFVVVEISDATDFNSNLRSVTFLNTSCREH